jgi:hypothetical protein
MGDLMQEFRDKTLVLYSQLLGFAFDQGQVIIVNTHMQHSILSIGGQHTPDSFVFFFRNRYIETGTYSPLPMASSIDCSYFVSLILLIVFPFDRALYACGSDTEFLEILPFHFRHMALPILVLYTQITLIFDAHD